MDNISFSDFAKTDIRIGTVIKAEVPEWSHWVMRMTVDLGSEIGEKLCFSGIMKFYKPEDMVGNQYPFVVNLEPKKVGPEGEYSECMMIMACPDKTQASLMAVPKEDEETSPVLFKLSQTVPNGTKVY